MIAPEEIERIDVLYGPYSATYPGNSIGTTVAIRTRRPFSLDGKQVLHALRQDESTRDIPVLVLSGMERGVPDDWPGAQFVGKPFSPDELVRLIRKRLAESA